MNLSRLTVATVQLHLSVCVCVCRYEWVCLWVLKKECPYQHREQNLLKVILQLENEQLLTTVLAILNPISSTILQKNAFGRIHLRFFLTNIQAWLENCNTTNIPHFVLH